nr:tubulin polyglutamylase ttll9 [Hymenolepis microstoma]
MEYHMFLEEFKKNPNYIWIMKPVAKSQGRGIFLFRKLKHIEAWRKSSPLYSTSKVENCSDGDPNEGPEHYVVSRYIENPYLIGGRKFDLRVFVLVTSFQPLKAWVYRDGFARLSNVGFSMDSINDQYVHLTNVAIQKTSPDYDATMGCKWSICRLRRYMIAKHGNEKVKQLFREIDKIFLMSLLSVQNVMISDKHCFELYGYDILVDDNLKPWLLEINASPSLTASSSEDYNLKVKLLDDTLSVIDMEGRLNGDEKRIGDFDCVWNDGPVAPITNPSKNFLSELRANFNLSINQQTRSNSIARTPIGTGKNLKRTPVDISSLRAVDMSGSCSNPSALIAEVTNNLEKRQRNLLKRKAKLESYKNILSQGGKITSDQASAVNEFDSVCQFIDAIKEIIDAVNETQQKVSFAILERDARLLAQRDDYTVNIIRKVSPILELLSKSQVPVVKDAIIKASSFKDFKTLEGAAKVMHVRIPASFKLEAIDSTNCFQSPAEFLFKLASGSQEPLVSGKNGKSKSPTFSDLRKYCYELLVKEEVRAALHSLNQLPRPTPEEPKQVSAPQPAKLVPTTDHAEPAKANDASFAAPSPAPLQQADILLSKVIDPLKSEFNFVQPVMHEFTPVSPVTQPAQQKPVAPAGQVPAETVPALPHSSVERKLQVAAPEVQKRSVTKSAEQVNPVSASHSVPQVEASKSKPESPTETKAPPRQSERIVTAQPPSFQSLMDSQIAEQKETVKEASNQPLTWADRVRAGKGAPVQSSVSKSQPIQQLAPSAAETTPNGGHHSQLEQPRSKSGQSREPREHRPPRTGFNSNNREGRERNGGNRSGPPRGGFRGNGREGRGNGSFRGGRGRGGQRGSFYPRGGFDGQNQAHSRQETGQASA